jgi:quercetin dioxygenase-like cupin family protein
MDIPSQTPAPDKPVQTKLNPAKLEEQLHAEGFRHTYVWQDGPSADYPGHTHPVETAHIILEGELTLTMSGESSTYGPGQRCDVPAGAMHSARMGPTGCRYLIGEK